MKTKAPREFRVIIVGAGVAGLTLAHCLAHRGIDFLLLEARGKIAPEFGAPIAVLPNALRILDQLGICDSLLNFLVPLRRMFIWTEYGQLIAESKLPEKLLREYGYPFGWIERSDLLGALFEHLETAKSKIHFSKRVISTTQCTSGVAVQCSDGSSYCGSIIAGADGVHSAIRSGIWEMAGAAQEVCIVQNEKNKMISEYSCVFGTSTAVPGLAEGDGHVTFGDGFSVMFGVGTGGLVFWLFFTKLECTYSSSSIPKFDNDEIAHHVQPYLKKYITADVTFESVYTRRKTSEYVPLEEAFFEVWNWKQCVCIGDSVHKMTPNLGQGANSAIETAASLANGLSSMLNSTNADVLPADTISRALNSWATFRKKRMKNIWIASREWTRVATLTTGRHRLIALYIIPYFGDHFANLIGHIVMGGETIQFLNVPKRSQNVTKLAKGAAWTSIYGKRLKRIFWIFSLFICAIGVWNSWVSKDQFSDFQS